jgi:hypothetical protein
LGRRKKMADTLVVEDGTGKTTANTYITLDGADTYHENRLHVTDWTGATETDKEASLIWATRMLDDMVNWKGLKTNDDQALRWPRSGVYDEDELLIDEDTLPTPIAEATAELARHLIAGDRGDDPDTLGFKRMKVASLELEVDKFDRLEVMPDSVWQMVKWYGTKVTGARVATLLRT